MTRRRFIQILAIACWAAISVVDGEEMKKIEEGSKAPDFTLPGAEGKKYSLKDQLKDGPVVLVVYRSGDW